LSRTENPRDMETRKNRIVYLEQFAQSLLRDRRTDDEQDLNEFRNVIDQLRKIQPDLLSTLILEVELERVSNRLDKAEELIQSQARRENLTPVARNTLAGLAERLERFELAEQLYRQVASGATADSQGKLRLARFLGRRGRVPEALDICESLWSN